MGKHRSDGTQHMEGDLFDDPPTRRNFEVPEIAPIKKPDLGSSIAETSLSPDHY